MPSRKQQFQQRLAELTAEGQKIHDAAEAEDRPLSKDELAADKDRQEEMESLESNIEAIKVQERRAKQLADAGNFNHTEDPGGGGEEREGTFSGETAFGEWLQAVADFGAEQNVTGVERKDPLTSSIFEDAVFDATPSGGLNETALSEGAAFLSRQRSDQILEKAYSTGQILSRIEPLPVSPGFDGHKLPAIDEKSRADGSRFGGLNSAWLDAGEKLTGTKPKFHMLDLGTHRLGVLVYITNTLLRDAAALQSWVNRRAPDEIRFRAEDAIFNGHGAGMPLGWYHANYKGGIEVAKETGQDAGTLVKENIDQVWSRFYAPNRPDSIWVVDQSVEPALDSLSLPVGTGGAPVFMPPGGIADSPFGRLKGRPVIPIEYGAVLGTVGDIGLFSPNQYAMSERAGGLRSDASMHVRFEFDEMAFRFIWELDGEPEWHSALTPKSGGPTQSAFVKLATRA